MRATILQQSDIACLDERAASQGNHSRCRYLFEQYAATSRFRFRETVTRPEPKDLANELLLLEFNFLVEIKECPAKEVRQRPANAGFARAHKAGQRDDPRRGFGWPVWGMCRHQRSKKQPKNFDAASILSGDSQTVRASVGPVRGFLLPSRGSCTASTTKKGLP